MGTSCCLWWLKTMDTLFFYTVYKVISVLGILFYNSLTKSYYIIIQLLAQGCTQLTMV